MFYLDLFRKLEEKRVRYMLVGGLAMNLHGVPRATMDVDLVLAMDDANLRGFLEVAKELRLQPVASVKLDDLLDSDRRKVWITERGMVAFALSSPQADSPIVDLIIEVPIDIDAALDRVQYRDVGNTRVVLASVEDMIRLKEGTGREQDLADIEHLQKIR